MTAITRTSRPRFAVGVRLTYDRVRDCHALLYPEGVLLLNETAGAVLARCDGHNDVTDISTDLAVEYQGVCDRDVAAVLQGLADRRLVEAWDGG